MNRAYRRIKIKEQRRKDKEDKMFREICSDLFQRVYISFIIYESKIRGDKRWDGSVATNVIRG